MGLGAITARRALKNPQQYRSRSAAKQKTRLIPLDLAPGPGPGKLAGATPPWPRVKKIALITAIFPGALSVVLKVEEPLC